MIAALLLTLQAIAPAPATPPPPPASLAAPSAAGASSPPPPPPPLAEWPSLPVYPMPRTAAITEASTFVHAEVEAGRCHMLATSLAEGTRIIAPVAILVGPSGAVRRIVPRAIGCPTVEQFTVGYLLSLTRTTTALPPPPGWYQLTITYRW